MKRLFLDLETTGLKPEENGIMQVGGIIEVDGHYQESFVFWLQPFETDVIEDRALNVTKKTRENLARFPDPIQVHGEFTRLLDKYVDKYDKKDKMWFMAYNSPFDNGFVREWFNKCGHKYYGSYFHSPDICVMRLAADWCVKANSFPENYKLGTVAKHLHLDVDDHALHDAMEDIILTRSIYHKVAC